MPAPNSRLPSSSLPAKGPRRHADRASGPFFGASSARTGPAPVIVSGGQTGVDRAALDVALEQKLPCTGWCPGGRRAEDGTIPRRYPLRETPSRAYAQRTWWNVRDADATLILYRHRLSGGTALTARVARTLGRPLLVADLSRGPSVERIAGWIAAHRVGALNIAGPRESQSPGIYSAAHSFLQALFPRLAGRTPSP
jgi:hypothetical protein